MREKVDRWAFLLRRSKWPNRIVLLFCCAVFVFLLFQAYAITIPTPSLWRNVVNAGREAIGIDPINPWRDWLYDFQSLIGGILAVIAAAFTVLQMRISDERSGVRHNEMVKLQLRSDTLLVERLLVPQFRLLSVFAENLDRVVPVSLEPADVELTDEQRSKAAFLKKLISDVNSSVLLSDGWLEAQHLFDGATAVEATIFKLRLESLRRRANSCAEKVDRDLDWIKKEGSGLTLGDEARQSQIEGWVQLLSERNALKSSVNVLISRLRMMAATYEVKHLIH